MKRFAYRAGAVLGACIILTVGAGIAWGMHYGANKLPIRRYFSTEYTNAVWDWSNPLNRSSAELRQLADFMYLHQLNAVYVDVGVIVSISQSTDKDRQYRDKQQLTDALAQYVSALQRRGIQVYASAGDVHWSDPDKHQIPLGILAFAHEYNERYPDASLAGVQFDIESYNQQGFNEGSALLKSLVLIDYLAMADKLVQANLSYIDRTQQKFELGFAIPYWFDNQNDNIPSVTWRNQTGPVLFHLLDRLNDLPKSNVVVMSYRNAARGNDGVIAHSRTEIDYAAARAPRVKVIIGQEVTDVEPAKITYYGQSRTELSAQFKYIKDEFTPSGVLGGIAINDLAGYKEMPAGN